MVLDTKGPTGEESECGKQPCVTDSHAPGGILKRWGDNSQPSSANTERLTGLSYGSHKIVFRDRASFPRQLYALVTDLLVQQEHTLSDLLVDVESEFCPAGAVIEEQLGWTRITSE